MKNGDKVKIKDGSYMLTINDGVLSHSGKFESTKIIGWCKDTFTILDINGNYPADNENRPGFRNDTIISNDSNGEIWFCSIAVNFERIFIPYKAKEPKFKVGQWIVYEDPNAPIPIRRIKSLNGTAGEDDNGGSISLSDGYRPATKEEIEAHLRKICERYVGKKVKSLNSGETRTVKGFFKYDVESDTLFYNDVKTENIASIYKQGKFAEIIPDLMKKPETWESFKRFLAYYCEHTDVSISDDDTNEFLDQYQW